MEDSPNEMSAIPPDRIDALAFRNGLASSAFVLPASLIFRSNLPPILQVTVGILLWAAFSAFLLFAVLFSVAAYRASRRLPWLSAATIAVAVLIPVLMAIL